MQYVFTYAEIYGNATKNCKLLFKSGCSPYIKLFVNGEKVLQSTPRKKVFFFDADIMYTTPRIRKNSTIAVEIWDAGTWSAETDALIQRTEGNIESFLSQPLREGVESNGRRNSIEAVSFWQDKFE